MEVVDTLIVIAIPGAMAAGLLDGLFWGSLALALDIAGLVAYPVNRWLIASGSGPRARARSPLTAQESIGPAHGGKSRAAANLIGCALRSGAANG